MVPRDMRFKKLQLVIDEQSPMFIRTVAESKTQPCITFVETLSGVVIRLMCARKGGYEDLTKEILLHLKLTVSSML